MLEECLSLVRRRSHRRAVIIAMMDRRAPERTTIVQALKATRILLFAALLPTASFAETIQVWRTTGRLVSGPLPCPIFLRGTVKLEGAEMALYFGKEVRWKIHLSPDGSADDHLRILNHAGDRATHVVVEAGTERRTFYSQTLWDACRFKFEPDS
jgi:hypothetical protein